MRAGRAVLAAALAVRLAVITPLKPHVGHAPHGKTGGKPGKRAAKPKPAHLEQPRKPTAKRTAKAAAKTARPARKR